eukprot:7933889-Pyramimonas_sp.AAC.1
MGVRAIGQEKDGLGDFGRRKITTTKEVGRGRRAAMTFKWHAGSHHVAVALQSDGEVASGLNRTSLRWTSQKPTKVATASQFAAPVTAQSHLI